MLDEIHQYSESYFVVTVTIFSYTVSSWFLERDKRASKWSCFQCFPVFHYIVCLPSLCRVYTRCGLECQTLLQNNPLWMVAKIIYSVTDSLLRKITAKSYSQNCSMVHVLKMTSLSFVFRATNFFMAMKFCTKASILFSTSAWNVFVIITWFLFF